MPRIYPTAVSRFWSKVNKDGPIPECFPLLGPCWLWRAGLDKDGYGRFWVEDRNLGAHRYAYEITNGPIPEGLVPDHLCRTPACVRPTHLEAVTIQVNTLRGDGLTAKFAVATHCVNGHEFTPQNTGKQYRNGKTVGRCCKACNNEKNNARYWAKRRTQRLQAESQTPEPLQ